jgi:hypothetical protein
MVAYMDFDLRQDVRSYIDENRDRMLSFLADIVETPSVSGHEKEA